MRNYVYLQAVVATHLYIQSNEPYVYLLCMAIFPSSSILQPFFLLPPHSFFPSPLPVADPEGFHWNPLWTSVVSKKTYSFSAVRGH